MTFWTSIYAWNLKNAEEIRDSINLIRRHSFESVTSHLTEKEFTNCFRMNRTCFTNLHELIRTEATLKACMGHLSNGPIESDVSLIIVLRVLAGASMLDLAVLCGISTASVHYVFKDTVVLLQKHLQLDGFPGTEEVCKKLEMGFRKFRNPYNTLRGCVGASDGISVKIGKPKRSEFGALSHYWYREGYYSLPVQAVVDCRYRFLYISAKCVGSTHDSTAFYISSFTKMLDEAKLLKGYWIAADEAYICTNTVITPIPLYQTTMDRLKKGSISITPVYGSILSKALVSCYLDGKYSKLH